VERVAPDKREEWQQQLEAPFPGMEKAAPTERQIEVEGADFMATLAMHQSRKG
jgi:hypothetical protein